MRTVLKPSIISHPHSKPSREPPKSENQNPHTHSHHNIPCSIPSYNISNLQCHQPLRSENTRCSMDRQRLAALLDERIMVILEPTTIHFPLHIPASELPNRHNILRDHFPNPNANLHIPKRSQKIKSKKQCKRTLTKHSKHPRSCCHRHTQANNNSPFFSTTKQSC